MLRPGHMRRKDCRLGSEHSQEAMWWFTGLLLRNLNEATINRVHIYVYIYIYSDECGFSIIATYELGSLTATEFRVCLGRLLKMAGSLLRECSLYIHTGAHSCFRTCLTFIHFDINIFIHASAILHLLSHAYTGILRKVWPPHTT